MDVIFKCSDLSDLRVEPTIEGTSARINNFQIFGYSYVYNI